jgi:hypothetical protein
MAKYIPYERVHNYAKHRCKSVVISFSDRHLVHDEYSALQTVTEYLSDNNGTWTASYNKLKHQVTVYSTDEQTLAYVSMI